MISIGVAADRRGGLDPVELLLDVDPVLIEGVRDPGLGRRHHIRARQHVEPPAPGQVSDVDPIGSGRLEHVDVPVVDAAMDRDVANLTLGRGGRILAGDVHDSQDRPRRMPILAEGRLGPGQGGPTELPVRMEPERIAGQDDDPILLAGVIQATSRGRRMLLRVRGARNGHSPGPSPAPVPWDGS